MASWSWSYEGTPSSTGITIADDDYIMMTSEPVMIDDGVSSSYASSSSNNNKRDFSSALQLSASSSDPSKAMAGNANNHNVRTSYVPHMRTLVMWNTDLVSIPSIIFLPSITIIIPSITTIIPSIIIAWRNHNRNGFTDWTKVATELCYGMTSIQCRRRWEKTSKQRIRDLTAAAMGDHRSKMVSHPMDVDSALGRIPEVVKTKWTPTMVIDDRPSVW